MSGVERPYTHMANTSRAAVHQSAPLSLFVRRKFLDPETCGELRERVLVGNATRALVAHDRRYLLDEKIRRAAQMEVDNRAIAVVSDRLAALQRELQLHFGMSLSSFSTPKFLLYARDDYFRPHADTGDDPKLPPESRRRKVSAVIFLNSEKRESQEAGFKGGRLTFHDSSGAGSRLGIVGEQGLLVAFPASVIHEVTRIRSGKRLTVVSWFYS